MIGHSCQSLILSMLLTSLASVSAYGETLFVDDFDGPNLNPIWQGPLPNASWRFVERGSATFLGPSGYSFQSLDGSSVIRLQNSFAGNAERRGWSTSTSFPTDAPILYEARVNTLVQSLSTGFDELIEIWLIDANDPNRYDIAALTAPGYDTVRYFAAGSTITDSGIDTPFQFANNTWYRVVISGSRTQEVRASIYNDAGTVELIGVNFGHNLSAFASGFKLGISQSMGFPNFVAPTDAALDFVTLTRTPTDDADGDGVVDDEDACADSDLSATVVIRGCDSEVRNSVFPSGCTIPDIIGACPQGHGKHGRFADCVSRLAQDLKEDNVITRRQKRAIQRCVASPNHH